MKSSALVLTLSLVLAGTVHAADEAATPAIAQGEHDQLAAVISANPQLAPNPDQPKITINMMGDHVSMSGSHDTTTVVIGILLMIAMMAIMM